jgi:hypothetical protein
MMSRLKQRRLILAGCTALALGSGAILAGALSDDFRREVRVTLGLPKFWVTDFNRALTTHPRVACPDADSNPIVIVTGGQSNASNALGPKIDVIDNPHNTQFFADDCFALESPVLGANGYWLSVWPKLGDLLERETGRPVVFISGAVGGSQISDFTDHRSGYLARLANTLSAANTRGLQPDIAIWIQGETDAAVGMDADQYVADQRQVVAEIAAAAPGAPPIDWIIALSTRCYGRPGNGPAIELALKRLANSPGDNLHLGPRVSGYGPDLRYDGCHLNPAGRDRLARELMETLRPILAARTARKDGGTAMVSPKG